MKFGFVLFLFLALILAVAGQAPTPTPAPLGAAKAEVKPTKELGSSLKKYGQKASRNSPKPQTNNVDDDETIRVETDLFVNDVLVSDQKGNVVTGLEKSDFKVTQDGVEQTLELFSRSDNPNVPRSIVLLFDQGSLGDLPYLKSSIKSAKGLVDKLNPNDEMAIVTASDLKIRADFTRNKSLLKDALDPIVIHWAGEGRNIVFESLIAVLNEMFDAEGRQRIVIVLGGGEHVIWLKDDKDAPYPVSRPTRLNSDWQYRSEARSMRKIGFSEVKEVIESSRTTIYSVIPGIRFLGLSDKERMARGKIAWQDVCTSMGWKNDMPPPHKRFYEEREARMRTAGQAAMYRVAELSGGLAAMIEKPEDADRVFSAIFATIQSRYALGYYVNTQTKGSKRRSVKVEVRGHPEYAVTGRTSYYLP